MTEDKITVYILVSTLVGKEYDILDKIRSLKNVVDAYVVYGEYDIIARIEVVNLKELDKIVTTVRQIEGVTRTSTLITASG